MWWLVITTACITYRTSIKIFPLPRQHIELNKRLNSKKGYISLKGLVNIDREIVYWNNGGDLVFGPKITKAMQKYKCKINDIKQNNKNIVLDMSILRVPHKISLNRSD